MQGWQWSGHRDVGGGGVGWADGRSPPFVCTETTWCRVDASTLSSCRPLAPAPARSGGGSGAGWAGGQGVGSAWTALLYADEARSTKHGPRGLSARDDLILLLPLRHGDAFIFTRSCSHPCRSATRSARLVVVWYASGQRKRQREASRRHGRGAEDVAHGRLGTSNLPASGCAGNGNVAGGGARSACRKIWIQVRRRTRRRLSSGVEGVGKQKWSAEGRGGRKGRKCTGLTPRNARRPMPASGRQRR
ncbi:hypothetical protein DFH06DRAFT_392326 [Mycena polygramma]|nr:hypothetical protein DFH06DRAFT_392326 [Mycena polygramma]